jgi:serine/threonine protein kinase
VEHPDEEHFTICGTPNYIAPEVASQLAHGTPADLWSVGCLFYSLVTGSMPFEHAGGVRDTLQKIIAGEYEKPSGVSEDGIHYRKQLFSYALSAVVCNCASNFPSSGIHFLRCLLDIDPRRRETAKTMLNHSFIRKHCLRTNSKVSGKSVSPGREQSAALDTPETSVESDSEQLLIPKQVARKNLVFSCNKYYDNGIKLNSSIVFLL